MNGYARLTLVLIMVFGALAITPSLIFAQTDLTAQRRAELQAQLDQLEKEIAATNATLSKLSSEGASLARDIKILDGEIKKAKLQVQATDVAIRALAQNITVHSKTIDRLSGQLGDQQQALAQAIRDTRELDDYSLIELAFSSQSVSDFFGDIDAYTSIKQALSDNSKKLSASKEETEEAKSGLENQKSEQERLRKLKVAEQQKVQEQEAAKQRLLAQTKGEEARYRAIKQTQEKTAAQIRAELFTLAGGSGQIPLPTAIALAKQAGAATGVRPAFILGVLKQETNLGANVGTGSWSTDMHPTRDKPVFLVITENLGVDPDTVKVSKAPSYGWGGAMGPSQFIPSTWACYGGYVNTSTGGCGKNPDGTYAGPWEYNAGKDRIAKMAGHPNTPSNPWNNLDAFTATAIYMADLGAAAQTREAERTAALRYFAGGNWSNPAYAFYGDGVMGFADQFQKDIDTLAGQ